MAVFPGAWVLHPHHLGVSAPEGGVAVMKVKRAVWLGFVFCTNAMAVYLVCKAFIPWQRAEFDKFMVIAKVAVPVAVVAGWSLYYELFGRWGGHE